MIGEGTVYILLGIIELLDAAFTETIYDHYHRGYAKRRSNKDLYLYLQRLVKQGLIEKRNNRGKIQYKLTQHGKTKLLLQTIFKNRQRAKDGSTVVVFDIPEEKKHSRKFLRSLLLRYGFINLQESVLIGPYELPKVFFELLSELKIREHVTVMKSKVIYL